MQYAVREPRIASNLFSTTRAENVRANLEFIATEPDPELLAQVREILGGTFRMSWKNT